MQGIAALYVKAIDTAKENPTLSTQKKSLLNKFKFILLSGSVDEVDSELTQLGMVKRSTVHSVRELADGIYEDRVRGGDMDEDKRMMVIGEGRNRVDEAEHRLIEVLTNESLLIAD